MRTSHKTDKLDMLMEFSAIISSSLNTAQIRQRVITAVTRLLDADSASLLLRDRETDELFFEITTTGGAANERLGEIRLQPGEGISGWVARAGVGEIINDVQNDSRFYRHADLTTSYETRTMTIVPVRFGTTVIGVLEAINKRQGVFTPEDLELLTSLAHQLAPALENARMHELLRDSFFGVSMAFAEALEMRDSYTGGHTLRVSRYSMSIGARLRMDEKEMESLWLAAILHDIGKIGVADCILQKNGRLDKDEFSEMCKHSLYGAEILSHIKTHRLVIPGVRSHHENFDGSGYPDQLKGEEIPLIARIIAAADAFDAMTSDRPYRRALTHKEAFSELQRCRGSQFDPIVVDAFLAEFGK